MNKLVLNDLNDIREFCLCHLNGDLNNSVKNSFFNDTYVSIHPRMFIWKILMCNEILNLINFDANKYIDVLQKSTPYNMSHEQRNEIWNFMLPIYIKLKEYSSSNFKPTDIYLTMSNDGHIKEKIVNILRKSGAHSWVAYITPITEKFWVECDFTFSEFAERISETNIPKEWWDFHQKKAPQICDE